MAASSSSAPTKRNANADSDALSGPLLSSPKTTITLTLPLQIYDKTCEDLPHFFIGPSVRVKVGSQKEDRDWAAPPWGSVTEISVLAENQSMNAIWKVTR